MRKTFELGITTRGTKFLIPNDLASRRCSIFGISGSGKSNTATVCVEGLLENGEQAVVLDPKGEGWGLRSSADGKSAGFDVVVFGEPYGDIEQLDESHGEHIADFVIDSGRSVVLSMLGFDTDQAERRFVARFFRRLFRRKTKQARRTRILMTIDEAHLFVPEGGRGEMSDVISALQRCVRQGRSFGIGSILIDQRPQDVSKRLVTQSELLIIHNLSHNLDRTALEKWTDGFGSDKEQKELLETIATLQPGEAWIWSPVWLKCFERVQVNLRRTFDSARTPDGSASSIPSKKAHVDLDQLRQQLQLVVDEAKANDPTELRRQIKQLETELRTRSAVKATPATTPLADIERIVGRALGERDGMWNMLRLKWRHEVVAFRDRLVAETQSLGQQLQHIELPVFEAPEAAVHLPSPITPTTPSGRNFDQKKITGRSSSAHPNVSESRKREQVASCDRPATDLPAYDLSLLQVLIDRHPLWTPKAQLAAFAGKSTKSSAFGPALRNLINTGLAQNGQHGYLATSEGLLALPGYEPAPPSGEQALNHWLRKLPKYHARTLQVLYEHYPAEMTREDISVQTGYSQTSSAFGPMLRDLVEQSFVVCRDGQYKIADMFF